MKTHVKTVHLHHINYVVRFRRLKKAPQVIGAARAYVQRDDRGSCTVYLPEQASPGFIAHELVHVLQYICIDRYIDFDSESEHMAYTMQYLMGQVLGYVWAKN